MADDHKPLWDDIKSVDDRLRKVQIEGCGLKKTHEKELEKVSAKIRTETEKREEMERNFNDKLDEFKTSIVNNVMIRIGVMLAVAVIASYFLGK